MNEYMLWLWDIAAGSHQNLEYTIIHAISAGRWSADFVRMDALGPVMCTTTEYLCKREYQRPVMDKSGFSTTCVRAR